MKSEKIEISQGCYKAIIITFATTAFLLSIIAGITIAIVSSYCY